MPSTLIDARSITRRHAARTDSTPSTCASAPAAAPRSSAPTAPASPRCSGSSPGWRRPMAAAFRGAAASATCRSSPLAATDPRPSGRRSSSRSACAPRRARSSGWRPPWAQARSTRSSRTQRRWSAGSRGADADARLGAAAAEPGIDPALFDRPLGTLSGGRGQGRSPQPMTSGARQMLEAALEDWPGALVVATHDRRLREALRPDRELAL
jgi:hypothetical protein